MKLHYAETSPYVRKVMVVAHECGLADCLDLVPTTPETVVDDVKADNPLAQIPTLVTESGERIFDSTVICEYLDAMAGAGIFERDGPARWTALTRHALGQGLIDALNARNRERRRPETERSPAWDAKKRAEIVRALDALEAAAPTLPTGAEIGAIGIAVALAYHDFRWSDDDWRGGRPALTAWYEAYAARPAMRATAFPGAT